MSPSPGSSVDFGRLAEHYDAVRPVDENWWEVYELVERAADLRGRRVLDVGCGTGRLTVALAERAHAKVWGVDASPAMLAVAKKKVQGVAFKQADAGSLPFKDGWFERAVLWLVLHLVDRPAALAEARRVLGADGLVAVVSFDESHFDAYWLNDYLPSLERVDRKRFPTGAQLVAELREAGFADVETMRLDQRATLSREEALLRLRARHISTFDLIGEDEIERGLAEAERTVPETVEYELRWLVAVGSAA
ncbi:MAG: methyltransferase domain-containing protein [Actinobacteria bacterium]|nr:methyltransferase domain-containing protein [Actinomycetota bacterium]